MKKLRKLIAYLITATTLLTSGIVSLVANADTPSKYETEKVFVTQFDNYNDISGCSSGLGCRLSVNKMQDFIKRGKGSMILEDFSNSGATVLNMYADSSASNHTTYSIVESFNISVYNSNNDVAQVTFLVQSTSGVLVSQNFELQPSTWNNLTINQNRLQTYESSATIHSYSFQFTQAPSSEVVYYFDDFYLVTSQEQPVVPTKQRTEGEILHFDSLIDLNLIAKNSLATKGRTSDKFSINLMNEYAQKDGSLLIDVTKNGTVVSNADVWTDGTVPYYAEQTGFSIIDSYLSEIDFTKMDSLKMDIFHTYGAARKVHLIVTDRDANTATISQYIESDSWTTLEITDFSSLNKGAIASITFYYEAYQTFRDYEIYIDNLVMV